MIVANIPMTQDDLNRMRHLDRPENGIIIPMLVKGRRHRFIVRLEDQK